MSCNYSYVTLIVFCHETVHNKICHARYWVLFHTALGSISELVTVRNRSVEGGSRFGINVCCVS